MLQDMINGLIAQTSDTQTPTKFGLGDIGMTALEELIRDNPDDVKGNVSLAFRYEDEVCSVLEERLERVNLKRNLREVKAKLEELETYAEKLKEMLKTAKGRQAEAETLLKNINKSEPMQSKMGDAINLELKNATTVLTVVILDISTTNKAIKVAKNDVADVEKALSSTAELPETTE